MVRYLLVIVLGLLSTGALAQQSTHPSSAEKAYISAAGGYLKTQNAEGLKVARTGAGLSSGQATLGQLRKTIKDARSVTNAAYRGDYLKSGKLVVPKSFASVDETIRKSHKLRDASYIEYLAYWKDKNAAHIHSATLTFKQSELLAQQAQKQISKQLQAWGK